MSERGNMEYVGVGESYVRGISLICVSQVLGKRWLISIRFSWRGYESACGPTSLTYTLR